MTIGDQSLALIDHHVHGAVTGALDRQGVMALLTEGTAPAPAGTTPAPGRTSVAPPAAPASGARQP